MTNYTGQVRQQGKPVIKGGWSEANTAANHHSYETATLIPVPVPANTANYLHTSERRMISLHQERRKLGL